MKPMDALRCKESIQMLYLNKLVICHFVGAVLSGSLRKPTLAYLLHVWKNTCLSIDAKDPNAEQDQTALMRWVN